MKNASIFHGWGGSPRSFWFPWLTDALAKKGYDVWCPELPDTNNPCLEAQLEFVLKNGSFNDKTVLVGHSAGCPLILAALERLTAPVAQVILVAGFCSPLPKAANQMLQHQYDSKKIRANARDIIYINSNDDPWGCDDMQGRLMLEQFGGTLVLPSGQGHFGSETYGQPYTTFPLLLKLID